MPFYIPYILVVVFSAMAVFASLSRGSFFTDTVKFCFLVISLLVLIASCIYLTLTVSWLHIFGLILDYILSARAFADFFSHTIFRH